MSDEAELSDREREILRLVATGASNKEIALALVISPNTVKVHLRNIFAKVGVASRTEATLYAIRTGLLPPPALETAPAEPLAVSERPAAPEAGADAAPRESAPGVPPTTLPGPALPRRTLVFLGLAVVLLLLGGAGSFAWNQLRPRPTSLPPLPTATPLPRWTRLAPLPEAGRDPAGAVYDNSLYVIGGETGAGVTGKTWHYDASSKRWQAAAAKPIPVSQASAALLGELIYVPGGKLADGSPTSLMEVYDPRSDRWETRAPLPVAVEGYALAAVEGRLYLFGGWDGSKALDSVYRYDPAADAWSARRPLPAPRAYAGAAATGGRVLVAGGTDGRSAQASAWMYYPTRDVEGENPWESLAPLPQPRYAFGIASLADQVYLAGGEGAANLPPLEYLSPENNWQPFEPPLAAAGSHGLLLSLDTHLHALGGTSPEHQAYQAIYNVLFPVVQ